jgi:hypothetical protein
MAQRTTKRRRWTTRSAGATTRDGEVKGLLDRMAEAITAGDGEAAGKLWGLPALVMGEESMVIQTEEEVAKFFGGAKGQYNEQGIVDTRPDLEHIEWVADDAAIVKVRWPYLDPQGSEVGEESSTYVLRRDSAGELRIRVALMHGPSKTPPPDRE